MDACEHVGSCWDQRCDAISRKTGEPCQHLARCVVPNTLAGHFVLDGKQFHVQGRPVHLCHGHASSWCARGRKLLSVRLKNRGYLSAYNEHGYGSVVTSHERIDFTKRVKIPKCWSAVSWSGRVPDEVAELLGIKSGNKDTHEG